MTWSAALRRRSRSTQRTPPGNFGRCATGPYTLSMPELRIDASAGERRLVSRRTVAKAAAWSVPALAVAVAAPLAAASVTPLLVVVSRLCVPGGNDYHSRGFTVTVTGTLPPASTFTLTSAATALDSSTEEVSPAIYTFAQNGSNSVILTTLAQATNTVLTIWLNPAALLTGSTSAFTLTYNGTGANDTLTAGLDASVPPLTVCS